MNSQFLKCILFKIRYKNNPDQTRSRKDFSAVEILATETSQEIKCMTKKLILQMRRGDTNKSHAKGRLLAIGFRYDGERLSFPTKHVRARGRSGLGPDQP